MNALPRSAFPAVTLAAAALAASGCSSLLRQLDAPDAVVDQVARDEKRMASNLTAMVASGEIAKTATFDMEQEHHLGKTVAATVLARLGGRALPPSHPASRYVRDVGTSLALAAAERREADDRPYPRVGYRFIVVETPQINAVGAPGGLVLVTTGLLRQARSEDELAAVLAHEVAHVQRGHTMQPVEAARRQEHLSAGILKGTSDATHAFFGAAVSVGADVVLDKGLGKRNELAADAFAVRILEGAGYDPQALPAFLGRLTGAQARGGFFDRHPPAAERARALTAVLSRPAPDVRRARLREAVALLP